MGPSHAPAPVPPDVHHGRGTGDAELWARIFGFYSGSGERQYCLRAGLVLSGGLIP